MANSACPALRACSDATHHTLPPRIPVYRPPFPRTPVSDCTVPCRYVVHPGYAYPSALLWVDLPFNKVGPCQNTLFAPTRRLPPPSAAEPDTTPMQPCRLLACLMTIAAGSGQALLSRETHSLQPDEVVLRAVQQEEAAEVSGRHAVIGAAWPRPDSGATVVQGGLQSEYAPPPPPGSAANRPY